MSALLNSQAAMRRAREPAEEASAEGLSTNDAKALREVEQLHNTNAQRRSELAFKMNNISGLLSLAQQTSSVVSAPTVNSKRHCIFVAGGAGMGKSTLINELAGADILPAGGAGASLTMTPVQLVYEDTSDWHVAFEWVTVDEWRQNIALAISDIETIAVAEDESKLDFDQGLLQWANVKGWNFAKSQFPILNGNLREVLKTYPGLWPEVGDYVHALRGKLDALKQAVPKVIADRLATRTVSVTCSRQDAVAALLSFLCTDRGEPAQLCELLDFHRLLLDGGYQPKPSKFWARYGDAARTLIPECRKFMSLSADTLNYWPLIRYVTVSGRFEYLPRGVMLVDTPGSRIRVVGDEVGNGNLKMHDWQSSTRTVPADAPRSLWYVVSANRGEEAIVGILQDLQTLNQVFSPEEVRFVITSIDFDGTHIFDPVATQDKYKSIFLTNLKGLLARKLSECPFFFSSALAFRNLRSGRPSNKAFRGDDRYLPFTDDLPMLSCGIPALLKVLETLDGALAAQEEVSVCEYLSALIGWLTVVSNYRTMSAFADEDYCQSLLSRQTQQVLAKAEADISKHIHNVIDPVLAEMATDLTSGTLKERLQENLQPARSITTIMNVIKNDGSLSAKWNKKWHRFNLREVFFCMDKDPRLSAAVRSVPHGISGILGELFGAISAFPTEPALVDDPLEYIVTTLVGLAVSHINSIQKDLKEQVQMTIQSNLTELLAQPNFAKQAFLDPRLQQEYSAKWRDVRQELERRQQSAKKQDAINTIAEVMIKPLVTRQKSILKTHIVERLETECSRVIQDLLEEYITKRVGNVMGVVNTPSEAAADDMITVVSRLTELDPPAAASASAWSNTLLPRVKAAFPQQKDVPMRLVAPPSQKTAGTSDYVYLLRGLVKLATPVRLVYDSALVASLPSLFNDTACIGVSAFACAEYVLQSRRDNKSAFPARNDDLLAIASQVRTDMCEALSDERLKYQYQQRYSNTDPGFMKDYAAYCDTLSSRNDVCTVGSEKQDVIPSWRWAANYLVPLDEHGRRLHGNPHVSLTRLLGHATKYAVGLKSYQQGSDRATPVDITEGDIGVLALFRIPRQDFEEAQRRGYCNDVAQLHRDRKLKLHVRVYPEQEVCFYGFLEQEYLLSTWTLKIVDLNSPAEVEQAYGADDSLVSELRKCMVRYKRLLQNDAAKGSALSGAEASIRKALKKLYKNRIRNHVDATYGYVLPRKGSA